ncbi:MAG TPA: glycoside hydrolase family 5 protein [Candidatus Sulfotelmatobacter sp.]|nr:glycoside hydrolase family 5 protein [Candidatus Sulfotelmatobacter sp.]
MKRLVLLIAAMPGCISAPPLQAAFTPENPPEMKSLAAHDTPAWHAAKLFQHGANLGNYLEVPPGQGWSVTFSPDETAAMKHEGFDHVRVPVGWQHYAGPAPDFTLSPEIFSRVDLVVTNALASKLAVMINIHHFDELDENPQGATEEFLKIWEQVAAHYRKFPRQLAFELDNEPHSHATTTLMNPIYAQAIAEIRKSNPHRTIFVEPGNWGSIDELKNLVLPPDDNVIVSIHCYDPFYFTHQGATWTGGETPVTGIVFPGPPATPLVPDPKLNLKPRLLNWIEKYNTLPTDKNPSSRLAFETKLKYCRAWSDFYGRPVHLGEFGAFTKADETSRANFYSAMRRTAEQEKIGWCIWDWSAGFRYWDQQNHQSLPGLHAALFDP